MSEANIDVDMIIQNVGVGGATDFSFIQQLSLLVDQRHAGVDLFGRQLKKSGNMTTRDDHRMTRAHRIRIARAVRQFVTPGNPFRVSTKQTRIIGVAFRPLYFLRH